MALRLVGFEVVHMDRGTFMWIQLTHFAVKEAQDDCSLLTSLVASDGYAHDYASPFDGEASVSEPAIHGRWWRSSIHADAFEAWAAGDAASLLQSWADNQDWTDPDFRQPPPVQEQLKEVYALLRTGELYKLVNPGSEYEHEYGFVTGQLGFHEFVVIDRSRHLVHVVVASDD